MEFCYFEYFDTGLYRFELFRPFFGGQIGRILNVEYLRYTKRMVSTLVWYVLLMPHKFWIDTILDGFAKRRHRGLPRPSSICSFKNYIRVSINWFFNISIFHAYVQRNSKFVKGNSKRLPKLHGGIFLQINIQIHSRRFIS